MSIIDYGRGAAAKLSFYLLAAWTLGGTGGAYGSEPAPGLLFYASFDAAAVEGADFARGTAVPRTMSHEWREGRFGQAAHVPVRGVLDFDAHANLKTRRGTLAFWASPDVELFSKPYRGGSHAQLVHISSRQLGGSGAFLVVGVNGPQQRLYLTGFDADWRPAEWGAGEWHHIAITWDAARGRRLYHNGELVLEHEAMDFRFPALAHFNLASRVRAGGRSGAVDIGFGFDEVYVLDYELTAEQVRQLVRDNRLPQQRNPLNPELRQANDRWLREKLNLDDPAVPQFGGGVLRARRLAVERIESSYRDERRRAKVLTRLPMDGRNDTGSAADAVTVRFTRPEPFNFVRVVGGFDGELRKEDRVIGNLSGLKRVQRLASQPAGAAHEVLFENRAGTLNEVDFYELSQEAEPPAFGETARHFHLRPVEASRLADESGRHLDAFYDAEDQTALAGVAAAGEPASLTIEAGRFYHFLTEPMGADRAVDRLFLDLSLSGFAEPAVMAIRVYDPVTHARRLLEFEVGVTPGQERVALLFEGNDWLLESGHRLWISVVFDQAGRLHYGDPGSRIVLDGDRRRHGRNAIAALERIASDGFVALSEPQPWRASSEGTDPPRQLPAVGELFALCEHILRFDPEARTASALYSWMLRERRRWDPRAAARYADADPLAAMTLSEPGADGPDWAVYGREALKATRAYVDWWVNERQDRKTGMLGGGVSDDTTLMPGFVNFILIGDEDGRLRRAVRTLADYTWETTLDDGLADYGPSRVRDHLHAYEEGTNVQHLLPRIFYGEPEGVERLIITSRYYEDHLTGFNPDGRRLMRSHNFSAAVATPPPDSARYQPSDDGLAMIFMPGRILTWYNASPQVQRVLLEWQDAWLHYAPRTPGNYFGRGAIDFETGRREGSRNASGELWYHLFWAYAMTGEDRYLEPVRLQTGADYGVPVAEEWRMIAPASAVVSDAAENDRAAIIAALRHDILEARKYLPVHTWVGQSTDRIQIPQNTMARMFLGGLASQAKRLNYHFHAVSWEGADDDVARFVTEKSPNHLKVLVYNFHEQPQEIAMRAWQLAPGRYRIRAGSDLSGDEQIDRTWKDWTQDLWRYEAVSLVVPPRQVFVINIQQEEAFDWRVQDHPDLAIGPESVRIEGNAVVVTVHNLGSVASPATTVQLRRGGQVIAERPLPPLEAPNDLRLKRHEVRFEGIRNPAGAEVLVNPGNAFREITAVNNRRVIPGN